MTQSSDVVIRVENLSKRYLVGHQAVSGTRYNSLREIISRNARELARKTGDMTMPLSHYTQHKTYKQTFERLRPVFFSLYKLGYVTRSFYLKYCVFREIAAVPARPAVYATASGSSGSSAAA